MATTIGSNPQSLDKHEKSINHLGSLKIWLDLKKTLKEGKTVDAHHQSLIEFEKKRWYFVLERIIMVIEYLASQNLAFRGKSEKLNDKNNGNFLKLIEAIAKFDSVMAEHVNRVQTSEKQMPTYLGHEIQNELIDAIGQKLRQKIVEMLKSSKYFAIIVDSTPDASRKDQLTIIVRFVYCNPV